MPEITDWLNEIRAQSGWRYYVSGLQWTTTPPTEPGWYWATRRGGEQDELVLVEMVYVGHDGMADYLVAYEQQTEYGQRLSTYTHWLGPLPEPESPTP